MNKERIILSLGGLGLGLFLGYAIFGGSPLQTISNVREKSSDYRFINPLLFTKVPEDISFPLYLHLKNAVENYVRKAENSGNARAVSVYFRNLDSSQWIGVNPTETFSPASMLKVVTLIATLREAEYNPALLKSMTYIKKSDETQNDGQTYYLPENPVIPGQSYTIDELLQRMIIDSDNIANSALYEIIGADKINQTYTDLELPVPNESNAQSYTTQQYSHLFRTLYNGTYLSKSLSEKVLELLSHTNFDQGLVAGVPEGVVISHKFGVRNIEAEGDAETRPVARELHDCGIIYNETSPYFLCIMTRGEDFASLEGVIKDISKITWEEMERLK